MFKGAIVAIVTPFKKGKVDEASLRKLIEFQIKNGTDGIVPCGTTGESSTLSHEEHDRVIEITIDAVKKRVPVFAGTGSNSTAEAIRLTRHAYKAGADGAMMVSPYCNRPTQEGLYQHYKAVAEAVPIPIIVYNIPSRTGVNINPDTLARLAKIKNIIGVKEASGSIKQMSDVISQCGAGGHGGPGGRLCCRGFEKGESLAFQDGRPHRCPLHRNQPDAGQGGSIAHEKDLL
jgi:4-hydroxy-tetrahydrodipicolinate synthase